MKQIVHAEAVRRRALYDAGKAMFAPVLELLRAARAAGAEISLRLDPPSSRKSEVVSGMLRCRSFHAGVGRRMRRYMIEISPGEKTCEVWLDYRMSDDDYDHYHQQHGEWPGRDHLWACTYRAAGQPSMADLKQAIEEALITQLTEREGGLDGIRLSGR